MKQRMFPLQLVTEEHKVLYQTSATFKTEVDTLCQMIPLWIDGLANNAKKIDEWVKEQTLAAMNTPGFKVPEMPDFTGMDD